MRRIFHERYQAARAAGRRPAAAFLVRSVIDVVSNAALERVSAARRWILFPQFHEQLARCEQERRPMVWQALMMDLRYALRMFVRTPVFTGLTVLALALGIGANSAIFSVVNGVLLRPLPYANPDRLVMVWSDNTREGVPRYPMSPANFLDVKAASRTLDRMEMMYSFLVAATLRTNEGTEQLVGSGITPGMFELLGRTAALGRTLQPSDRTGVVVISDGLWRRRFGADPTVVGRQIILNEQAATIVGVMPPDFHFPLKTMLGPSGFSVAVEPDGWFPLDVTASQFVQNGTPVRSVHYLSVVGRLAEGATHEMAHAQVAAVAESLAKANPDTNFGRRARVGSTRDALGSPKTWIGFALLITVVALLMLLACANIMNLLIARLIARRSELAVRTALGATHGRVVRQIVAESLVIGLAGGALGVALARGESVQSVAASTRMVAEGVPTVRSALALAHRHGVSLPICTEVGAVLFDGKPAPQALAALLSRTVRPEED
jgi:predicted permease